MMIKKLKTITSQYKLFVLLAAFIPVLGFILIWQQLKPKAPLANPVFGSLPLPATRFELETKTAISYQLSLPTDALADFPDQLDVYQIKELTDQETVNRFAQIANDLGFSVKPKVEGAGESLFYVWQEGNKLLKVNARTGQFFFQGEFSLTLGEVTPQEAEDLVKEKLRLWKLLDQNTPSQINFLGVAGMELEPVTNPNLASVYEIIFSPSIDGYLLIGFGPAQDLTSARVTKEGKLIALTCFLHQVDREKVGCYPLKSSQLVLAEIQAGQGKIFNLKTKEGVEANLNVENPIKTINLTAVKLGYYESVEKQVYLQPVYLFSGTATLKDDEVLEVSLYLPAITNEWLIQASPTPASRFKVE
jgi:hypothetical protein